jgi:hypothetical protein
MAGLVEWADGGAIEAGPGAARNIAPLRFLEHCGFSIVASQYRFHRWLDEPPGPESSGRGPGARSPSPRYPFS